MSPPGGGPAGAPPYAPPSEEPPGEGAITPPRPTWDCSCCMSRRSSRIWFCSAIPSRLSICADAGTDTKIALVSSSARGSDSLMRQLLGPLRRGPRSGADRRDRSGVRSADGGDRVAVLRPGFLVVAERGRPILAVADRADSRGVHATRHQIVARGVGATLT